jgi:hypothetical protein
VTPEKIAEIAARFDILTEPGGTNYEFARAIIAQARAEWETEDSRNCCAHGIHWDNACGACSPPRGTTIRNNHDQ